MTVLDYGVKKRLQPQRAESRREKRLAGATGSPGTAGSRRDDFVGSDAPHGVSYYPKTKLADCQQEETSIPNFVPCSLADLEAETALYDATQLYFFCRRRRWRS